MSERDDGAYGQALEALESTLAHGGGQDAPITERLIVAEGTPLPDARLARGHSHLVVALGANMAQRVLAADLQVPVLCALIPESAYDAALDEAGALPSSRLSALYLEQPWSRQLQLIRLAFPDVRHVAVVFGPTSRAAEPALREAAEALSLTLHTAELTDDEAPLKALRRVLLDNNDVLLAIPDPKVFNAHSVQGVLMATYRRGVPVVGFSRAYVAAGATVGIYTEPAQVGRETAELILRARREAGLVLPKAHYPRAFTVRVNRQVARSLGITIPDADELERRLKALEPTP